MLLSPFSLFAPFKDNFRVALFTKKDDIQSDAAAAKQLGFNRTAGLWQVHGNRTIVVESAMERTERADGMITATSGLLLCTRSADCQSFVVYEPNANACGVLHVGWRGLIAGAIPNFFRALREHFNVDPRDTYVACGPSLCQKCAGFREPSKELPTVDPRFINENNCVDLQGVALSHLKDTGIPLDHFERHPDCTCCNPDRYWTYRGGDRQAVREGHTNMLGCMLLS